jgi:hypothetical protein
VSNTFVIKHPDYKGVEVVNIEGAVPSIESIFVINVTNPGEPSYKEFKMRVAEIERVLEFSEVSGTDGRLFYRITLVPVDPTNAQPKRRK